MGTGMMRLGKSIEESCITAEMQCTAGCVRMEGKGIYRRAKKGEEGEVFSCILNNHLSIVATKHLVEIST